jgi:hypothetical protein
MVRHVEKVGIAAGVKLVGALQLDAALREQISQHAVDDRRPQLCLDIVADDRDAGLRKAVSPFGVTGDEYRDVVDECHACLKRAFGVELAGRLRSDREIVHQNIGLFRRLTLERYIELRIDHDAATPRLLGVRDDGRHAVDVEAMSDGTADQLYLALRLAAVEQSIAAGIRLPFLADDLFINFDDIRSTAGLAVLAELATKTQVLFFTHHAHLAAIARTVVGADLHSECALS